VLGLHLQAGCRELACGGLDCTSAFTWWCCPRRIPIVMWRLVWSPAVVKYIVYLQRSRDGSNLGAAPQNHQNLKWDGYGWFTTKNGPTSVSGPLDLKYWHILTNSQMLHVHLGSWCPVSSRPSQGCACWWPTGGTWVSSQANQQNHAAAKHCELLDDIYCMYYIYIYVYIYTYIY